MANEQTLVVSGTVGKPIPGRPETCRMFEAEWLERFSRIHPVTPFVVWVPVALYFLWRSRVSDSVSGPVVVLLFCGGMCLWTLAEYLLHRYVFHFRHDSRWGRRIHFLLHGVHHDFPSDADRLVMPLLTSTPMAVIFYSLFGLALGPGFGSAFFAGFVVGYLFYDGTHYYVHHFTPRSRWGKLLRRHHLTHHFADHHGGFGVSTPLWDLIFRSMPRKRLPSSSASRDAHVQDQRAERSQAILGENAES